jgi:hypothetical protein
VVAIRSQVWPGAATFFNKGKAVSVYFGYGHKAASTYCPSHPEPVIAERTDRDEFPEPNGPVIET